MSEYIFISVAIMAIFTYLPRMLPLTRFRSISFYHILFMSQTKVTTHIKIVGERFLISIIFVSFL